MCLAFWVHTWEPYLIRFTETIGIRYYGLAYVLGFVGAAWIMIRYAKTGRTKLSEPQISDLMVWLVLGVVIGGRLGYFLFYHPGSVAEDPLVLFKVWEGGMAFHGGFAGVGIALLLFARRSRIPFFHIADVIASVTSIGLLLGRIANFINGELWGRITTVPWAVIFPDSDPTQADVLLIPARHPSQLYEAFLEGLVLLVYVQLRFWRSQVTQRNPGQLAGEYLLGYGVARIICEVFREPDASLLFGMSRGTVYSIALLGVGVFFFVRGRQATKSTP